MAATAALLSGCQPPQPPATSPPATSPAPTASASTASPSPDASLPSDFPVRGSVIDDARRVVAELQRVSGGLPAVKLDISQEQVTLAVLAADDSVRSYRWRDGRIGRADSDVQFVGQATFDPADFPLDGVRRMLEVAAMTAGSSSNQVLQIVDYGDGRVFMSVTTRPESKTVFFLPDGSAILQLGYRSVADIESGLKAVSRDVHWILAFGFNAQQGYWADVQRSGGVIERRTRTGMLPAFVSRRNQPTDLRPFETSLIDPAVIARTLSELAADPSQSCSVEIDNRFGRVQPVIRYDCGGVINYTDLQGRDMTDLVG